MAALGVTVAYSVGTYDGGVGGGDQVLQQLAAGFERAGVEVAKWGSYLLPDLVPVLESAIKAQFDAEGDGPAQGSWAPLSAPYRRWKDAHWPGRPTLVLTGALKAALTVTGATGALRDIRPTEMSFGTSGIEYASYHQTGAPDANLPARPPVDFGFAAAAGIRDAAENAMRELMAVARLDQLLEGPIGPQTEAQAMFGPMTKQQVAAAKGKATRIEKLKAIRKRREGR